MGASGVLILLVHAHHILSLTLFCTGHVFVTETNVNIYTLVLRLLFQLGRLL